MNVRESGGSSLWRSSTPRLRRRFPFRREGRSAGVRSPLGGSDRCGEGEPGMISDYQFTVRPLSDDDGGGYLVEFPDLPGCMSDGETIEEAVANGQDAKASWIAAMTEAGRRIPPPTVEPSEGSSGKWQLGAPKSLHRKLAERARREGVSLNTLAVALLSEDSARNRRFRCFKSRSWFRSRRRPPAPLHRRSAGERSATTPCVFPSGHGRGRANSNAGVALMEGLAPFGPTPCIHEASRGFVLHRAAAVIGRRWTARAVHRRLGDRNKRRRRRLGIDAVSGRGVLLGAAIALTTRGTSPSGSPPWAGRSSPGRAPPRSSPWPRR